MTQGWEIAAATIGGLLLTAALAALAGLGIASALFGGGWVWPHGTETIGHVIAGVLTGHPGRGLPPADAALVAPVGVTYGCIAGCEVATIAVVIGGGVLVSRYRRPNDARSGMASRGDANRVLGVGQLRAARQIIRPDLHPSAALQRVGRRGWRPSTGARPRTESRTRQEARSGGPNPEGPVAFRHHHDEEIP